jgi:fibronectin-binding autotransporter adhesin
MKPTARLRSYLFAASSLLAISSASAETWVPTATGTYSWNTNANWTPATFPNATSATADLNIDIAAAQTINLNQAITAGILNIGDASGNHAFTLATGTSGSLTFNNGGTSQLNHGTSTAVDTISAQVTLADNLQITNSGATAGRNNAFNFSGKVTGTGSITLNAGTGWVYLSNLTNDYSGGLTLNSGATVMTGGNSNGFGTGTVTINGGSISTAFGGAASQPITTSNTNVWNGNWTLISDTSPNVITFNGGVTLGANVAVTANQFLVLNNNISETGSNRVLTMNGSGSMTLRGTNTYSGGTTISLGTVQFGKIVSMPATGTVAAATGTTLAVGLGGVGEWTTGTSGNGTLGGLISANTGSLGGQAGSTVNWAGTATVGFDTSNATSIQNYTGNIVNRATTLGVTKLGGGTLTLSGANTYTGATTVRGGILNMSGTFGNHVINVSGGLLNFTSTAGGNGAINISGGTMLFAGTKSGGAISLTAGTLQIGTATPSNLGGGQIVIVGGISSDSTTARTVSNRFVMNGPITLGSATNTGKLTFTDTTNTSTVGSAVRVLTVLSDVEFAKAFFNGGGGGIQKEAGATMTISGGNSPYTGATIVNGGLLALGNLANLNGTATLGTAVTVNNGGTFGVRQNASATTNAIGQVGQTTASTLTLNAGSAVSMTDGFTSTLNLTGTATLAPATLAAPVLTFDLIGANSDLLAITGAATVGAATARIAVSPTSTPTAGTSFTVITAASGLNTNFTLANPLLSSANGLMSLAFTGSTATSQIVAVSDDPNALYWSGATDGDWNTATNWNTSIAGGGAGSVPGASNNVTFSTTTPVAANLTNTLSAPLTVNSLNFLPATSAVTVAAGSAITVSTDINDNSATNQTINTDLTVTGRINKTGAGVLTLAGSNTISGTTALDNGTLQLQNANAITATSGITTATTSAVSVATGTTIQLRSNATASFNTGLITLPNGAVNIDVNNNGSGTGNTLTLGTASNTITGVTVALNTATNVSTVLNVTGGNSYGLALGRIQNPTNVASTAFTVNAGTVPVSIAQFQTGSFGSNFIVGSGTVTLSGLNQGANGGNTVTVNSGATLILSGATTSYNTRAGGTRSTVLNSGGTLHVNHVGALSNSGTGTNAPSLVINGGTLDNTAVGTITIVAGGLTSPTQTWNSDFTFTGTQNLNLGNGAVSMAGGTRTVTTTANTLTIGGAISGGALTKAGAGTLTLGGANTYNGNTTVSAGTLVLSDNARLSFVLGDTSGTNNSLTGAGTATLDGDFTIDTSAADSLVSGSWTLENVAFLTGGAYGSTFTVIGFTDAGSDNWTKIVGPKTYTFNETTGILTLTSGVGSPEINVNQSGDIANGGSKSFGIVTLGSNTSPVFAINNTGTAALNLTGTAPNYVAVSGANASDFIVTAQPTTPVTSGGGTTNFTVQFTPSGAGLRSATLTILNNDSDEGTFTINVSGTGQTLYDAWSGGANFDLDANNDGVKNGLAWLLGAADVNANAIALLPTIDNTDPTHFIFTYRRKDDANNPLYTTIAAQYSTTLTGWTTAVDNADIDIVETDNHYSSSPGVDRVVVKLKRSTLAPGGKLFVRLNVVKVP